jgi:hypothetical protein
MLLLALRAALADEMTTSRTITFHWSLTSTDVIGLGAISAVAVKSWEVTEVARPVAIDELPELAPVPLYCSAFIVIGVPLVIIFVVGGLYSGLCRKHDTVPNPNFIDPAFFISSAAAPLARAKETRKRAAAEEEEEMAEVGAD